MKQLVWTDANTKPPHMVYVLTYSPHYHAARQRLEEGVAQLCWNENDRKWHDLSGEEAMFEPTHWRVIPQVILPEHDYKRLVIREGGRR